VTWDVLLTEAEMADARADAESLMTDACTITHDDATPTLNEETGQYDSTPTAAYSGKCRVQAGVGMSAQRDAGDLVTFGNRVVVSLPMTAEGVADGDLVTITAAPFTPQLVGQAYRVRSLLLKSHPTAIRLECEEA
jgi:hypothetical protein